MPSPGVNTMPGATSRGDMRAFSPRGRREFSWAGSSDAGDPPGTEGPSETTGWAAIRSGAGAGAVTAGGAADGAADGAATGGEGAATGPGLGLGGAPGAGGTGPEAVGVVGGETGAGAGWGVGCWAAEMLQISNIEEKTAPQRVKSLNSIELVGFSIAAV